MSSAHQLPTWYARAARPAHRARRVVASLATLVLAMGLGAGLTSTATAQEGEEPEPTQLEFTKQAWYTNTLGEAVPNALVETFPPQALCLVRPEVCGPTTEPVVEPIREQKTEHAIDEDNAPHAPAQPLVPDGTMPTGRFGGTPRYASAIQFDVPDAPEGKEIASFVLRVVQQQPTYSTDSPLFRQVVLAVLKGYQDGDPYSLEVLAEELMVALNDREQYPPADTAPMRVEACPAETEWQAGDNQAWEERPEIGFCLLGAEGERKELADGSIVYDFDLTTAARNIADGDDPNRGIFLHAFAAENMSYGDQEPTDAAQLSMGAPDGDTPPVALITYQDATTSSTFALGSPGASGTGDTDLSTGATDTSVSSPGSGSPTGGEAFSSAPSFESQSQPEQREPAPAVAAPGGGPDGTGNGGQQPVATQEVGTGTPVTPWYVWTLVPLGLAGMYLMTRALTATPAPAVEREGAMSRLIEQRRRSAPGTGPPQVQV